MIKYESTLVTFTEVPDELALCFNITGCPCHCEECFEPWLWKDYGTILNIKTLNAELKKHPHISCVCFMGGDGDYKTLYELSIAFKMEHPDIKLAMYSGRVLMDDRMEQVLDYYKIGPFVPKFGPMDKETTNQRFYKKVEHHWEDITYKFQVKKV